MNTPGTAPALPTGSTLTWAKTNRKQWSEFAQNNESFTHIEAVIKTSFDGLRKRIKAVSHSVKAKDGHAVAKRCSERKCCKSKAQQVSLKTIWGKESTTELGIDLLNPEVFLYEEIIDLLLIEIVDLGVVACERIAQ